MSRPTDNLEAYHLFLKGRHYLKHFTGLGFKRGLECLSQAIALEPSYAAAHASIAQLQTMRAVLSFVGPPPGVSDGEGCGAEGAGAGRDVS